MPLIELCDIKQIKAATGYSDSTIRRWVKSGKLKKVTTRKGNRLKFAVDEVNKLIRKGL